MNFFRKRDSAFSEFAELSDRAQAALAADSFDDSTRAGKRLERDRARGYSINVKQVVLAFAVEFVIIALILISQFIYASEIPDATEYKVVGALLFPTALAMVELARVPLAIAVRTQESLKVKLAALLGVVSAVVVTSTSLSNIGHLTFSPRLEDAQQKRDRLIEAQERRNSYLTQLGAEQSNLTQRIKDRDQAANRHQGLASQLNAQPGQNCSVLTTTTSEGGSSQQSRCVVNPALKPLQAEVVAAKAKLADAEAAVKQEQMAVSKYDRLPFDDAVSRAEAEYRIAVYHSQLHSYTAMLFGKDPQEVSDGEIKTLERYLIWIPSVAAALASTLIAMTAVQRKRTPPDAVTTIPDEAAAYLFGPLLDAIRKEANDAVAAAVAGHSKSAPNTNTS